MWVFILPVQLTHEHLGAVVLVLVDHVILPDVVFVSNGDVGSHVTDHVQGNGVEVPDLHQPCLSPLPGLLIC